MKDFLGNEINIGDKVVFIEKRNGGAKLTLGIVTEIDSGIAYMKIKYSDGSEFVLPWGSRSKSIYKVSSGISISDNTKKT